MGDTLRTVCPRDCYDSCALSFAPTSVGYSVAGSADEAINKGDICGKCGQVYNAFAERDRHRILSPLVNVGSKGQPDYRPITWEDALDRIARRLTPLIANGRGHEIVHSHYDGARGLLTAKFPLRLFDALGATGVVPGSVCHTAGLSALEYVFGSGTDGVDPRDFASAELIVLWGINPANSSPHAWRHWISRPGHPTIMRIDPLDRAERPRPHKHLRPRVGTDAVLAFGVMRALHDENLIDRAFLDRHASGFEALSTCIQAHPVDWCAERCGVSNAEIVDFARALATKRTIIWLGMGLQRQSGGGNIFRAIAMLPVLTGNLFRHGSGIVYLNGARQRGLDLDLVSGNRHSTRSMAHAQLADRLADSARTSALFTWNNNIAVSNPDLTRLHAALRRRDLFTVCLDVRLTRTCAYADIVLPAADFIEYDDLVYSYFFNTLGAQRKLREPLGQSMPNQTIFRRLAARLGLSEPYLHETDESIIASALGALPEPTTFAELARKGTWHPVDPPRPQFGDGSFATPSGRIEIASPRAAAAGYGLTATPTIAAFAGRGAFQLVTPASFWRTNTSFSEMTKVAEFEGPPSILIHRDDARRWGIEDGHECRVSNDNGSVDLVARISDVPLPGDAVVYKCRGEGLDPLGVEINRLIPSETSDMGECIAFHGVRIDIRPLRPPSQSDPAPHRTTG
jgi:anaerobic selenocysteine-containing dehydrogenase